MKKYLSFIVIALTLFMCSCSKQNIDERQITNVITIYINGRSIDNAPTTRSVLTNDPKTVENTVNNVTIAVFKSDGTVKTIKEFASPGNSVTMRVANLTTTDKVVCVANAKTGTFSGVKTLDEFNSVKISLDNAITTNNVNIVNNNLIMYGSGPIITNNDSYIANVDMYHLNAKISLNSFAVSLANNATFKIKEVYLINVPSSFKFSYDNPYVTGTYLYGSLNYGIPNQSQRLYLGSENLNGQVNKLFFYCSPNNSITYTKLVICGSYDADGNGPAQQQDTYYPIAIANNILANKNYVINVTIKGIGVDKPTDDLNYSNLTVNMTVNNFTDVIKDVVLD